MNYLLVLMSASLFYSGVSAAKKRVVIDQVALTIHGPTHTTHVCSSDLVRPSLEGQVVSVDKAIEQELVIQDMERFKVTNGDEGTKHIERMKKEHNYTDQDIKTMFEQTGRTTQEGIQDITRLQQYHGMEQMQTYANVFVSEQEINQYYADNPLYTEAEYTVSVALSAYQEDKAQQAEQLARQISHDDTELPWSAPVVIQEHELSDQRKSIIQSMKPLTIAGPFAHAQGYEIIRLIHAVPSALISFEQRHKTIKTALEQQKAETFLKKYHADLRDQAVVAYKQPLSSNQY